MQRQTTPKIFSVVKRKFRPLNVTDATYPSFEDTDAGAAGFATLPRRVFNCHNRAVLFTRGFARSQSVFWGTCDTGTLLGFLGESAACQLSFYPRQNKPGNTSSADQLPIMLQQFPRDQPTGRCLDTAFVPSANLPAQNGLFQRIAF